VNRYVVVYAAGTSHTSSLDEETDVKPYYYYYYKIYKKYLQAVVLETVIKPN